MALSDRLGQDRVVSQKSSRAQRPLSCGWDDRAAREPLQTEPEAQIPRIPIEVRLHRRRQTVVVRAASSPSDVAELASLPGRRRMRTLLGLDQRERLDTLWEEMDAPPDSRCRPVVLVDDIDDDRAEEYRAEAERILREGRLVGAS